MNIKAFLFGTKDGQYIAEPKPTNELKTYVQCERCKNYTDDPQGFDSMHKIRYICPFCYESYKKWFGNKE